MNIRRSLAATTAGVLLVTLTPCLLSTGLTASAAAADQQPDLVAAPAGDSVARERGPALSLGRGPGRDVYILTLDAPAVPTRSLAAEDGEVASKRDYRADLRADQASLTSSIAKVTGAPTRVLASYTEAINGMAVELTRAEALQVSRLDGVAGVHVNATRELHTDVGPEWIGAPSLWDGSATPGGAPGTKGEGVVVGILDSGINPANPSFADTVPVGQGGDGYDHTNPLGAGNYLGVCDTDPTWGCNDKLIGYYDFQGTERYDDDGHGSHTASTAAGNQVAATTYSAEGHPDHEFSWTGTIKGVAPHANIVAYDVCDGDGCQLQPILDALEAVITDGVVDAINYSIGSPGASDPWSEPDDIAFLNVRAAGVHVANSAGNEGPGAATTGSPGTSPWMNSVGATQHDRQWRATVQDLTADGGATLPDITGVGFSAATEGILPLVYAGDVSAAAATCGAVALQGVDLTGRVVVCDRGGEEAGEPIGRVAKGENVLARGAEGMILVNNAASGDSLNADAHALPTVHVTFEDGVALKAWMASVTGEEAGLSGGQRHVGDDVADIMASFSSRGPNRAVAMLSPVMSAPGVDILAAAGVDNEVDWQFISGTSMASPHVAGTLALLDAIHPTWSPAQAQSALATTAVTDILDDDGTAADWLDMGSGRVDLTKAARAGIVLDEQAADYAEANPAEGGDPRTLNAPSMTDDECLQDCSWTRTLTGTSTGVGTWGVAAESFDDALSLEVSAASLAVTAGGDVDLDVTAHVAPGAPTDEWLFGVVELTPPAGSDAPAAHLPVAVLPSSGVLPDSIDVTTRRDAGSQVSDGIETVGTDDLQLSASGLVPTQSETLTIAEDTTNGNPYDGNGVTVRQLQVPAGATRLVVELQEPTAPDLDLYLGQGATPSAATEVCASASSGSDEACEVANPAAGTWWVLVQNWEATTPGGTDTTELVTAVVAGDAGNLRAEGPEDPIVAGEPFSIRAFWDEEELDAGEVWYGSITLGSDPSRPSDIGVVPVTLTRAEDDVTKTADKESAAAGEVVTYTVDIASNLTPTDLAYSITDTLPEGVTYVEGSATNGATYSDGSITWEGVLPTTVGVQGDYEVTTDATDDSCVNPLTGTAEYLDLLEVDPTLVADEFYQGDSVAYEPFPGDTFAWYGEQRELRFTDDGYLAYDRDSWLEAANWYDPQLLPDPADPNDVAALLWQDMEIVYDEENNHGVTAAILTGTPTRVVEFDDLRPYGQPASPGYDMEVIADAGSSDLVIVYDNVTGPLDEVTIGTENADGTKATALVNQASAASVVADDRVVCMSYDEPSFPEEFSYQVSVDPGAAIGSEQVNEAEHTVAQPGAEPAVASHALTVADGRAATATSLSLTPAGIQTGGSTTATAVVTESAAGTPTGQVSFLIGGAVKATASVDASGRATATLGGFSTTGIFPVTASYAGDGQFRPSTSAPANLVVSQTTPPGKVTSKVAIKAKGKVEVGTRPKVTIVVTAPGVTPSGEVTVTTRLHKRTRTYTVELNAKGKAKLTLKKVKRTGRLKVRAAYAGDAAVEPGGAKTTVRVVEDKR